MILLKSKIFFDLVSMLSETKSIWAAIIILLIIFIYKIYLLFFSTRQENIENSSSEIQKPNFESNYDLSDVIQNAKKYIEIGKTGNAIQLIVSFLEFQSKTNNIFEPHYRSVLVLSNRFRVKEEKERSNLWDPGQISIEHSRINESLIEVIIEFESLINNKHAG